MQRFPVRPAPLIVLPGTDSAGHPGRVDDGRVKQFAKPGGMKNR